MDLTDEELLAAAEQYDHAASSSNRNSTAASSSSTSVTSHTAASSSSSSLHRPTNFNAAFGSMTSSSLYTSVSQMPRPNAAASNNAAAASASASISASVQPVAAAHRPSTTAAPSAKPKQPGVTPTATTTSLHTIVVSPRQKGNPVLSHISHVAWEYGDKTTMVVDYAVGETIGALYLSVKYHMLHSNYLQSRMTAVKHHFTTRILLVHVDIDDSESNLLSITKLAFAFGWITVCCWSVEEMARYLETLKLYEKKTSDAIQERVDANDLRSMLQDSLTTVRSINKTDVNNLLTHFSTFAGIASASKEDLSVCPGMGEKKVNRLFHVMNQPFVTSQPLRRPDELTSVIRTPAQVAAIHATNVAKAQQQAAVQAEKSRKGAVQYITNYAAMANPAPFVQQQPTTVPSTLPSAAASSTSSAAASALMSVDTSTTIVAPSTSITPSAPSASSAASSAAAASTTSSSTASTSAPMYDVNDFAS